MEKKNRYDISNLPLSQKTKDGLANNSLIDALKVISVMINTQDDVYEDEFSNIKEILKMQTELTHSLLLVTNQLRDDVKDLKEEIGDLKKKIVELTCLVNETRTDVEMLKSEVASLKKRNSNLAIIIRIALASALAYLGIRLWHGPL